ncbi:MAG: flagellar export protein FliJ [Rhodothermaceae bacterium]
MAKFKYKFESIKKIKKLIEKKTQKELMVIEADIQKTKQAIVEVNAIKDESKKSVYSKVHLTINEVKFQQGYERYLDEKIARLKRELIEQEKRKIEKLKELAEKSKEHTVFEKLKEKHYSDFILEENRKEQIEIDEIASIRYNRN